MKKTCHQLTAAKLIGKRMALGTPRKEASKLGKISSLGTARNYRGCLKLYLEWIEFSAIPPFEQDHKAHLLDYLDDLAQFLTQSTVDQHRLALQSTFQLKLPRIKAIPNHYHQRSYTWAEVKEVANHQSQRYGLATLLCYSAGLRASELITLRPALGLKPSDRPWHYELFHGIGFDFEKYIVTGKGGLNRLVAVPARLALKVAELRCAPFFVTDREIHYQMNYDIPYGQKFSQAFGRTSKKVLGFSTGAHGLRHAYAKRRLRSLMDLGKSFGDALAIVAQEMGHFRPTITLTYMR